MKHISSNQFTQLAEKALCDQQLQTALGRAKSGFIDKRLKAIKLVDDFDLLKSRAQKAKQNALAALPTLLTQFEKSLQAQGGQLHWAETPEQLNQIVLEICQKQNAKRIIKGKSMISEETGLNSYLEDNGMALVESDLGEYIIQLAKEPPSHIIAPAVHKTRQQVAELFKQHHTLGKRDLESIPGLVEEARQVLRSQFLSADVGITGANLLVAETGSVVLVTNEGNGDLAATLPPTHIVTTSIEKVVENMEDANAILEVLGRSATGQALSTYTSFFSGPKKEEDLDGPKAFHVVLLDNGRSNLMGTQYEPMLQCIKCGACLNHCPVYSNVGGHAYGWVYPGPMGSVLTPLLQGTHNATPLPNASTFCGRCEEVCPMGIPLPNLLRQLRKQQHQHRQEPLSWRLGLGVYNWISGRPKLYRKTLHWLTGLLWLIKPLLPKGFLLKPSSSKTFLESWNKVNKS